MFVAFRPKNNSIRFYKVVHTQMELLDSILVTQEVLKTTQLQQECLLGRMMSIQIHQGIRFPIVRNPVARRTLVKRYRILRYHRRDVTTTHLHPQKRIAEEVGGLQRRRMMRN